MDADQLLIVNTGSSSVKLRVLDGDGQVTSTHDGGAAGDDIADVLAAFLDGVTADAAVHRVVHGGRTFVDPLLVDDSTMDRLDELADLAPLHNPRAIGAVRALRRLRPDLPQVLCFDTAFHAGLPAAAAHYAVPAAWSDRWDVRRYGFHGLSHAYASRRVEELLGRVADGLRVVTAHLGAGASLAAVVDGRSVDTTMGFTPLDGIVMATRSGSVDPGLVLWVQRHGGLSAADVDRALEHDAGLLGLSRRSGDYRDVVAAAADGDVNAQLALDVHRHRLRAAIAAMVAAMGGVDALVFTGGIGEHAESLRADLGGDLRFLGVDVDPAANSGTGDRIVSSAASTVAVAVVAAREDLEMARLARPVLRQGAR